MDINSTLYIRQTNGWQLDQSEDFQLDATIRAFAVRVARGKGDAQAVSAATVWGSKYPADIADAARISLLSLRRAPKSALVSSLDASGWATEHIISVDGSELRGKMDEWPGGWSIAASLDNGIAIGLSAYGVPSDDLEEIELTWDDA